MSERVVVVGAGQAGLAVSHELTASGVEHVVLERGRVGNTWRGRWDSFCLVTPNWTVRLPRGAYDGPDPDGFMPRDEIVAHLERYARSFTAPVREGISARSLTPRDEGFLLETSEGQMRPATVVVTTGAYQRPYRPAVADALPAGLLVMDASDYRGPGDVASGAVLIVGAGQTGCQLAEELHAAGRDVFLSAGRVPWVPRRVGGRDVVRWIHDTGFFDQPRSVLPTAEARILGNQQLSGRAGGHDLNYRVLRAMGVTLLGRLQRVSGGEVQFASDLAASVAFGDARYDEFRTRVRDLCTARGTAAPEMPDPEPFDANAPVALPGRAFGTVIFTSGYRPDYSSWVRIPGAFDPLGFPLERDGASTVAPGLYFCGVHFMRTRKSSLLIGVGEDAAVVARDIARRSSVA